MMSDTQSPYILAHYDGERPPAPAWFTAALDRTPERTRFVSQGTGIELLSWGRVGAPGLLFLPGNGAHADWWTAIAPFFADEWRCATLSWSGMGRSDRREEGYLVETFAQEARDAIGAAELDKGGPTIVIGHSMGGMIGLLATSDNPDIAGLILIDTPLGMAKERMEAVRARAPKSRPVHRPFATLADGLARFRLSPPQECANDYMVDHIARGALVEEDGQWVWHFDPRRVTIPSDGVNPPVDRIACPMAFLYGEQSALLNEETLATTLAILPRNAPVVPIPDAAHHIPLDQPLALISALRALLACWPHTGTWPD